MPIGTFSLISALIVSTCATLAAQGILTAPVAGGISTVLVAAISHWAHMSEVSAAKP
jgi:hypothetical protein